MKSTAHFKGHPLHPILVCFPIAFYTGTLLFDILAKTYSPEFLFTAYNLEIAALISAGIAAVPGLIDYIYTVPPRSTAKKRGAKHALTNVAVIIFFVAALIYRANNEVPNIIILIVLDINMPIWDGIRTLKALKVEERYMNIPVIMFTTSRSLRDNELSLKLGAQGFVTKPVNHKDFNELYHRFAEACREG